MFGVKDILEATEGALLQGSLKTEFSSVSTDTRSLKRGALFIAIIGKNFDGHNFIESAHSLGAKGAVMSEEKTLSSDGAFALIKVKDTIKALAEIAKYHRKRFDIPVIGITGSNGKTTAKEMVACLLSKRYNVLKNEGTENNFIGVPKTLLKLNDSCEFAVLELGSTHPGEIAYLSEVIQPNCGVVLNIGHSHLEFFEKLENVRKEKVSLLARLGTDGVAVVNGDDPGLVKEAEGICEDVVTFGLGRHCRYTASDIEETSSGIGFAVNKKYTFNMKILGKHNIYNALASIAVASLYGVTSDEIKEAFDNYRLPAMRMEFTEIEGIRFIFDCYNSNPTSMSSALETLAGLNGRGRKIIVAGDMLELGQDAASLHRQVGKLAARAKANVLVGVGPLSRFILEGAQEEGIDGEALLHFENSVDAAKALKDILKEGDLVLVKGSRDMKMEEIRKCFITCFTR